ncbi:amino acid adenylation domain-containing protein [Bacillus pakistanensis]|uniref:Amino acid adenylation domain-containing protein n=1 Tax=Rossellomorea pakistanensis TaxID=992288 RepID=A0ABS2NE37_9BACI|nr:non-ribosomal peptide synthetase [Bacillus pakistanensis]MBM7586117.1 amino acid adenylation domain-containing protein [Bacillus pakistanensis]
MSENQLMNDEVIIKEEETLFEAPMSYSQKRLWFLQSYNPELNAYNISFSFNMCGELNVSKFEESLKVIVQRHEIFRTFFKQEGSEYMQVVYPVKKLNFDLVELESLNGDDEEEQIQRFTEELQNQTFGLTSKILYHFYLLRIDDHQYRFFVNIHHMIFDRWSFNKFMHELVEIYHAKCHSTEMKLPDLEIQYSDYAYWQQSWLEEGNAEDQLHYWSTKLGGKLPVLELPTDFPRPSKQTFNGSSVKFKLPEELSMKLKKWCQEENVTPNMALLAAYKVLLYRNTGEQDILIGTPIAGRNQEETEDLIGFFVNTLVIRTDLSQNPSFIDYLNQVKDVCLEAYSNQDIPFEHLVEKLSPERSSSAAPIFQGMFSLQNKIETNIDMDGVAIELLENENKTSKFDLSLIMHEEGACFVGELQYNTDLFKKSSVQRMGRHFLNLVTAVIEEPSKSIADFSILTSEEKELFQQVNSLEPNHLEGSIQQLFEMQVRNHPHAIALEYEGVQLSYSELNSKANQLAHYLMKIGVNKQKPVVVCLERTPDLMITILAVLKAGSFYLPVDHSLPANRMKDILEDSNPNVIITEINHIDKMGDDQNQVICLSTIKEAVKKEEKTNPNIQSEKLDLAYVIYTSGSTGKPKGVAIQNKGVIRLVRDTNYIKIKPESNIAQILSISFDVTSFEIWGALLNGAKLIIANKDTILSPQKFSKWLKSKQITTLAIPAALFNKVAQEEPAAFSDVENVLVGGEACSPKWVNQILTYGAPKRLLNSYGPSENTAITLNFVMNTSLDLKDKEIETIPIGKPVNNTQVYVLDKHLNRVPIGIPGELYIGGDGLALGYWNRPDLTKEKFIDHPFSHVEGAKLYKTGDIVKFLDDGNLDFIGRVDHQVKLRGFRIELGDIEESIRQNLRIKDAVVLLKEMDQGDKKLISYYTTGEPLLKSELRKELSNKLPDYMIPSIFIEMDNLPLTSNGKVDRQCLPEPTEKDFEMGEYIAPRNSVEEMLTKIWQEILNHEKIGIHDNFFEIGGHSLLATQVISRVADNVGKQIPIRFIFEFPTIATMSSEIMKSDQKEEKKSILVKKNKEQKYPLSFSQKRLWFLNQMDPENVSYNIPFAFQISGNLHYGNFEKSLRAVLKRHESLRTIFEAENGEPYQIIQNQVDRHYTFINYENESEADRLQKLNTLISEKSWEPFDLTKGPLFRAYLIKMTETDHTLLFVIHHIIFDGWSGEILLKEINDHYSAFQQGKDVSLANLDIQYSDYAQWQKELMAGENVNQQLDYWRQKLAGELPILELPIDYSRPMEQTTNGKSIALTIPDDLTLQLRTLSQKENATLYMTFLSAFKVLLYRYTGQKDVLIGTPVAGRIMKELESLIGFFINTVVIRTDLGENPTFNELLKQVRESCLEAYSHQDVPFEKLVEELQPERNLSHSPIFQVMFSHHSIEESEQFLLENPIVSLNIENEVSKFDLSLNINESQHSITLELQYNTDLFRENTIQQFSSHLVNLLESIVNNPNTSIYQLPILDETEIKNHVNHTMNAKEDKNIEYFYDRIDQLARLTPDRPAISFDGESITYRELSKYSDQVASFLVKEGYETQSTIGVYMDKNLTVIPIIIGIMKAGCVFVPLDPQHPSDRIHYIVNNVSLKAIFTQDKWMSKLDTTVDLLSVDSIWKDILLQPIHPKIHDRIPEHLAYIIFTSGTTGDPKGVTVSNRNLANSFPSYLDAYKTNELTNFIQLASIAFDVFIQDMLRSLCSGGRLILCSKDTIIHPEELYNVLLDEKVDFAEFVPALLKHLVTYMKESGKVLKDLKVIVSGADTWYVKDFEEIKKFFNQNVNFINSYGVTEATIDNTYFVLNDQTKLNTEIVPIGKPFPHVNIYIFDEQMQFVPQGVAGEMYIGGPAVSSGYYNRPDLTSERFLTNPFNNEERLYKTGDLARYLPDGNLEFIGRKDNQVKIRGYRIETSEIEASIRKYPDVNEVVVTMKEIQDEKHLVAYIISNNHIENKELIEFLKKSLPPYMVPYKIEIIDAFPLNANGKIDHKALPLPQLVETDDNQNEPRTLVEKKVAEIWKEVLNLKKISVKDNFFELGGHSLIATQAISRLQRKFKVKIPLKILFEQSTVEGIANYIEIEIYKKLEKMSEDEAENLLVN